MNEQETSNMSDAYASIKHIIMQNVRMRPGWKNLLSVAIIFS